MGSKRSKKYSGFTAITHHNSPYTSDAIHEAGQVGFADEFKISRRGFGNRYRGGFGECKLNLMSDKDKAAWDAEIKERQNVKAKNIIT